MGKGKAGKIRVSVSAKGANSFWRCGMQFTPEWREVDLDQLGARDEERLRAEPMLVVEDVKPAGAAPSVTRKRSKSTDAGPGQVSEEGHRHFVLRAGENVPETGEGSGPAKVAAKDCTFAEDRPQWASRGQLWVIALGKDRVVCDIKAVAQSLLDGQSPA